MKRNEFRIKQYRGKFYIERVRTRRVEKPYTYLDALKSLLFIPVRTRYEPGEVTEWLRVDDYGNHLEYPGPPNHIYSRQRQRYLDRRLDPFKTLAKAKAKVEEFFIEPTYHYLK